MKKDIIGIAVIFLFLASCSSAPKEDNTAEENAAEDTVVFTDEQLKNVGIETGTVTKQVINTRLKVNGVVDVPPQNIVSVSFPMGGYLKSTKLLPGMHVNRGEVIGIMEEQALIQLQQDYLMADAKLQYLQQEYERQKELNENKVNAEKTFQQAQADYNSQKVLVKGYAEKLRLIGINPDKLNEAAISKSVAIHSPINGFVSKVNVNIGKYVNPADVLFELINPADIHAALTVFEKDMGKIKIGQRVDVSLADEPGKVYRCDVILVTRNVDAGRSGIVHCHFEEIPKNLLPGMFLNAEVQVGSTEVIALPEEAIVRYANKQYVFEVSGKNNFKMLEVQTGTKENGRVEVNSGAHDLAEKKVVTKNAYAVLGKMKNKMEEE
jgi:membrane fusion protein, heavy metal efflux system